MKLYDDYLICVDEFGNIFNWKCDLSYFDKLEDVDNDVDNEEVIQPISLSHLYEDRGN